MFNQRDRLLAGLFAIQLLAAVIFGGLLIHTLHQHNKPTEQVLSDGSQATGAIGGGSSGASGGSGGSGGSTTGSGSAAAGHGGSAGSTTGGSTSTVTVSGGGTGGNSTTGNGKSSGNGDHHPTVSKTTGQQSDSAPSGSIKAGAPIKVGAIVTETGGINFAASAQATKAYIDQVDANGGVNGHQIQLLLEDDQESPARGQSEAQSMVDQGIFAFVGCNAPLTEDTIVPFLASNKIPLVGGYGEYAEYHSPWSYIFSASYGHYGYEMGKYLMSLGVKTPGLIYIDNGEANANNGLVNAFEAGVKAGGGTVNPSNIYKEQPETPSYTNIALSMKTAGVDGIATILDEASYNRLQEAMQGTTWNPIHVADPLWPDNKVTHTSADDGTYVATDFNYVNPGAGGAVGDYVSTVQKEFGSSAQINYIGEQGWLDAEIFVDALQKLGPDITRSALMNELDKMNEPDGYGLTGPLVPTTTSHDISHCLKFGKWTGDAVEPTTNWLCDNEPF